MNQKVRLVEAKMRRLNANPFIVPEEKKKKTKNLAIV